MRGREDAEARLIGELSGLPGESMVDLSYMYWTCSPELHKVIGRIRERALACSGWIWIWISMLLLFAHSLFHALSTSESSAILSSSRRVFKVRTEV